MESIHRFLFIFFRAPIIYYFCFLFIYTSVPLEINYIRDVIQYTLSCLLGTWGRNIKK